MHYWTALEYDGEQERQGNHGRATSAGNCRITQGTQSFKGWWFHSAENWKSGTEQWSFDVFVNVDELEMNWLEMHLVAMDGNFAEWFWSSVLIPEFVMQPSNWGIDQVWCAAALKYAIETNSSKQGCAQVPVISLHENTAQIKKDKAFTKAGEKALEQLFQTLDYPIWENTTLSKIINLRPNTREPHRRIREACEALLEDQEFKIRTCFQVALRNST
jgi:hypothetical protein